MLHTTELVLSPEEATHEQLWKQLASRKTGIPVHEINRVVVRKRSVDARSKKVVIRLQVEIYTAGTGPVSRHMHRQLRNVSHSAPVIIIGCGPAGMFAAFRLIELGFKPVIIERGKNVRERRRDLAVLNKDRVVNPDSNYCFGEGGAGTYSDGKLYTRSDKRGNIRSVLDTFIQYGASPDIAIDAHPHIGTNKLPDIITAMREAITGCGGEIHFNTRFKSFLRDGNSVTGVVCTTVGSGSEIRLDAKAVVLATGHSARDIFTYFHQERFLIEAKPFALGVRVEHPQSIIDSIQYHCETRSVFLPPAPYSLSAQVNDRGVYSFCMCPGGVIAAAATAPGEVVVNGWSPSKRNNPFANSGIVVSVGEADYIPFAGSGALRAMHYQQSVEQAAFRAGGENLSAPAQRLMDFMNRTSSSTLPVSSYIPGIVSANLHDLLPKPVALSLAEGLAQFGKKFKGYITNEAVLVATESRTSSPVKIPRDGDTLMHPQLAGLFPCGEGAGYAGGIMSAAMDGERVAEKCRAYLTR